MSIYRKCLYIERNNDGINNLYCNCYLFSEVISITDIRRVLDCNLKTEYLILLN